MVPDMVDRAQSTPTPGTGAAGTGAASTAAGIGEGATASETLAWFGVDEGTVRRVLAELSARGADDADLYFQSTRANAIQLEDGIVSSASSSVDQGVGLRCVIGDQVGYAYTEDLTEESMLNAARTAAAIANQSAAIPPQALSARPARADYYKLERAWPDVGITQKLPKLQQAERLARAADPAIRKVSIAWSDSDERVAIATLRGQLLEDRRPMIRMFVMLTAEKNGETQAHSSNIAGRRGFDWITDLRVEQVVREAVDRTLLLFEARRPPAGELPVVLSAGASGILLHEAIGHGLEADFNRKQTSIYSTMLGKQIAPDFVTIVDDGTFEHERGALNVDDEGNDTERTVLVENGVLRSYLHDSISARHYSVKSTGSGRRQSFRHIPMPRMRCTQMLDGPHTRDEIIASVKGTGIIAETFTNGQVQIGAGDYTFYIKNGWLIEDGRITAPIKDVNIIGNGPESLRRVSMAADDSKLDTGGWTCGKNGQMVPVSQGLPTVLVSKMTVGGENRG